MQNDGSQKRPNLIVHLIYAASFLCAVLVIIGYLIWDKYQAINQKKAEIEQQIIQKKQEVEEKLNQKRIENEQRIAQEKERKLKILSCTLEASKIYSTNWVSACKEQANKTKTALNNCINEAASWVEYMRFSWTKESESRNLYNLKVAQCRSLYIPNPKPNCTLPLSLAEGINKDYEESKKFCNEMIL